MDEESQEPKKTKSNFFLLFATIIIFGCLLFGLFAILFVPNLRPPEFEATLEAFDDFVFSTQEYIFNNFFDQDSEAISTQRTFSFDWEEMETILKPKREYLDKKIRAVESEIKAISCATVNSAAISEMEIDFPQKFSVQYLIEIKTKIKSIAHKHAQAQRLKDASMKNNPQLTLEVHLITEETTKIIPPLKALSPSEDQKKLLCLHARKLANLAALLAEKCKQLNWFLSVNTLKKIHERITQAFIPLLQLKPLIDKKKLPTEGKVTRILKEQTENYFIATSIQIASSMSCAINEYLRKLKELDFPLFNQV